MKVSGGSTGAAEQLGEPDKPDSVWIINHYAVDPRESSSGSRHFSLSRRLAEFGWRPVILAASTEHPSGNQRPGVEQAITDRHRQGVSFRYLRTVNYRGGLKRVLNILAFTIRLLLPAGTRGLPRPRVVIGSTVHPLAAWAASILAKRADVPFVYEVRDLWPQTLIDMGKLRERSLTAWLMRQLERALCKRAAAVITLLPFGREYFIGQGVPADKIVWISNGTDVDSFPELPAVESELFTIMYLGSIGRANGVGMIIEAFRIAVQRDASLSLEIVGAGPDRAALEADASDIILKGRVYFRDPVPKADVPQTIARADALVMNILDLDVYRYGVSMNKLFDYAAAARPILVASNARNNLVAEADAGIAVPAGDVDALSAAMVRVASREQSAQRRVWARNARAHVAEHYDYRVLGERLHHLLLDVVRSRALDPRADLDRIADA